MSDLQKAEARCQWAKLVKDKLVPLRLLTPVSAGVHEWSPTFRDLIFDIAEFLRVQKPTDLLSLAQQFRREHWRELLHSFSDEELSLLLLKAWDYELVRAA